MGENPKFEEPKTLNEEHNLVLERSKYLLAHIAEQDEQLDKDLLTGLKNRKAFETELERALKAIREGEREEGHHRAGGEPLKEVSVIFIDLDNFKNVNDNFDHATGDEVLKNAARVFTDSVRKADLVARFGGDEFLVFLPRANGEAAKVIANKILANLKSDPFLTKFNISGSIGICSSQESTDPVRLLKLADNAAKKAKKLGKNQARMYEKEDEV